MEINKKQQDEVLILEIKDPIDTFTAPDLEKCIKSSIEGIKLLVLDLKGVDYISSAGLRTILMTKKLMIKQGDLQLININEDVQEIFDLTNFTELLEAQKR